jgi:hypothetical protein
LPDQLPGKLPEQLPGKLPEPLPGQLPELLPEQLPEQLPGPPYCKVLVYANDNVTGLDDGVCLIANLKVKICRRVVCDAGLDRQLANFNGDNTGYGTCLNLADCTLDLITRGNFHCHTSVSVEVYFTGVLGIAAKTSIAHILFWIQKIISRKYIHLRQEQGKSRGKSKGNMLQYLNYSKMSIITNAVPND